MRGPTLRATTRLTRLTLALLTLGLLAAPAPAKPLATDEKIDLFAPAELVAPPERSRDELRQWLAAFRRYPLFVLIAPFGELVEVEAAGLPFTVYGGAHLHLTREALTRQEKWIDPVIEPAAQVKQDMAPDPMLLTLEIAPDVAVELIVPVLAELRAAGYEEIGLPVATAAVREPPPSPWPVRTRMIQAMLDAEPAPEARQRIVMTQFEAVVGRCEALGRAYREMGDPAVPPFVRARLVVEGLGEAIERCPAEAVTRYAAIVVALGAPKRSVSLRVALGATESPLVVAPGTPWRAIVPRLVGRSAPLQLAVAAKPDRQP